jgi:uncharacterized protein
MMEVIRHAGAEDFLTRAESWLLESEAENNLLLGIASRVADGDHPYEKPIYLATVERGGELLGCAWRTPPYRFGMTRMPAEALPALAESLGELYDDIPGVHGPEELALAFAELWCAPRGLEQRTIMHLRIHKLDAVLPPEPSPAGNLRPATPDDLDLVAGWTLDFHREATPLEEPSPRLRAHVARLLDSGVIVIWEDGEPVSMAAAMAPSATGIRVNLVYTPPTMRRRGYAAACVAELSRRQLAAGRSFCSLYTDLANPTSNSVYRRIGYRPVSDVVDLEFFFPDGE